MLCGCCVCWAATPWWSPNAAGCVNMDWKAGDLMLITDQIKIFMESPLRGENLPEFGVRFPDASKLYTPALRQVARNAAKNLGIEAEGGRVYVLPRPASMRPLPRFGLPASPGPTRWACPPRPRSLRPATAACRCWALPLLSNMAAGILDQPLSEQEVLEAAEACKG